jgi:saccharopine dehydrogenase-like NADP-dependent oxidoreductase
VTRVGVLGAGAVGAQVAEIVASQGSDEIVVYEPSSSRIREIRPRLGEAVRFVDFDDLCGQNVDVLVVCSPAGDHVSAAKRAIEQGVSVVSVSDGVSDVQGLLALAPLARRSAARLVVGAAFSPGVTCVLGRFLGEMLDELAELHVAKDGTGGPACARRRHRALKSASLDWNEGIWVRRPGGSGRELVWFPEPIGGADCYRASLPEALLLQRLFPRARRITARLSATRQDRFTSWLPMLSPPHADGGIGAVRIEARGRIGVAHEVRVAGAVSRPSTATAAMAALAVEMLLVDPVGSDGDLVNGAFGPAELAPPRQILAGLRHLGVELLAFEGTGS